MSETTLEHKKESPEEIGFGVITVSDSRYNAQGDGVEDVSGRLILDQLGKEGYRSVDYMILPDDRGMIADKVSGLVEREDVDVVLCTGGTGISERDVTIEALEGIIEKRIDGFGELFRRRSFEEIGASVMLTRVTAGVSKGVVIFAVPGSPNAVQTALDIISKEIKHLVKHARE
ncbi:MAG: MogA/MoaB family molybdenum cofactor biosynthesis protein [Candidatus Hydrothermarchaeales archaeon]